MKPIVPITELGKRVEADEKDADIFFGNSKPLFFFDVPDPENIPSTDNLTSRYLDDVTTSQDIDYLLSKLPDDAEELPFLTVDTGVGFYTVSLPISKDKLLSQDDKWKESLANFILKARFKFYTILMKYDINLNNVNYVMALAFANSCSGSEFYTKGLVYSVAKHVEYKDVVVKPEAQIVITLRDLGKVVFVEESNSSYLFREVDEEGIVCKEGDIISTGLLYTFPNQELIDTIIAKFKERFGDNVNVVRRYDNKMIFIEYRRPNDTKGYHAIYISYRDKMFHGDITAAAISVRPNELYERCEMFIRIENNAESLDEDLRPLFNLLENNLK